MNGVTFEGLKQVAYKNIPDPELTDPKQTIVKVEMAGLCGSDLHPFFGREKGLDAGTVMGHEFVGEVVAKGDEVRDFEIGNRVYVPFSTNCGNCFYCQEGLTSRCVQSELFGWRSRGSGLHGGQSELVLVPNSPGTLKKVPEGLSSESALLLGDNFSTGFYCAELAEVKPGGFYVVVGCGTVGLLAIVACLEMGAKNIIAIDPNEGRRKRAEQLGAMGMTEQQAMDYLKSKSPSGCADAVLELVGLPEAQQLAYDLLRPGGIMAVIGCHCGPNFSFSPVDAYNKNLTYRTGRCPARSYMEKLTDVAIKNSGLLDTFITHYFQPSECIKAYDIFSNRKEDCQKAVLTF